MFIQTSLKLIKFLNTINLFVNMDILNYLRISPEEFFDIEARFRELETCDDEYDTTMEEDDLLRDYRDASAEIREEAAAMLHRSAERNRKNEK